MPKQRIPQKIMTQQDFFQNAKWVCLKENGNQKFAVLRGKFHIDNAEKVSLNIIGLGFFKCYTNGTCINPDTFLPLSSECGLNPPPNGEILSGQRIYVSQFDITPHVRTGENVIAVHFAGGWYGFSQKPQAIYCITAENGSEVKHFVSDENCRVQKSFVTEYCVINTEEHDYSSFEPCYDADFDDSGWKNADLAEKIDVEYCVSDCPADKPIAEIAPKELGRGKHGTVYDCGRNTAGIPLLKIGAKSGDTVTVYFSEEILPDGSLDPLYVHNQHFRVVSDGKSRAVQPEFTWFGFRYFEVEGDAEVVLVKEIHADIPVTSSFRCDNLTLNWIYDTFVHTMLSNMHIGHPSDCPHIERRGYTGDGQLTCHAVLSALGARSFYEKWLQDIADSQDTLSGHIQYTAPYINSGGGPGGWGSAIVEVPYRLYKHFGDKSVLEAYYANMRAYIDFLEAHSDFGFVTSDHEGAWCLGDWCGPNILYPDKDINFIAQQIFVPPAFVNTYFMVKSLEKMCEIADIIGAKDDISEYREKIEYRKAVMHAAYFTTYDGNFIMNAQGANAFAVDLGIGNERTYANMTNYYKKLGSLDTGIFATDILIRTLFEHGDGELAVDLLSNDGAHGFEHWRKNGATTFHEYWDSNHSRSHNHPMFGAAVAYFFEYLLGIRQEEGTAGYKSLVIQPAAVSKFGEMSGSMQIPSGTVSVSYEKSGEKYRFEIVIPDNTKAVFRTASREISLNAGKNEFETDVL